MGYVVVGERKLIASEGFCVVPEGVHPLAFFSSCRFFFVVLFWPWRRPESGSARHVCCPVSGLVDASA